MSNTAFNANGVRVHRLDNGFTVALEHLPYLHTASFGLWIKTGSAVETASEAGLAHFLEHLFFKGTLTRTVHQIMEAVEGRGGYINASTSREYTNIYLRMPSHHVAAGIEILGDIAGHSLFADMEKERGVILEEISSTEDNPDELAYDLLTEYHWPDHPLGRPIAGTAQTVSALTREDVVRFYETWYKPGNMVFSIAGNFDEAAVLAQVSAVFGEWKPGTVPELSPPPAFRAGASVVRRPITQAHVTMSFAGLSSSDAERYVGAMMVNILGGGSTSRLFERIREEEGLAYSIYSYHYNYVSTGTFGVYQAVAPQNNARATELVYGELRRMRDEAVPDHELEMNREQIKGSLLMSLESSTARAARIAKGILLHGRVQTVAEIVEKFDAVNAEQIQELARNTFTRDKCAYLVVAPKGVKKPKVELP
ncbi:MAG: insulinase family protein [Candidatus Hydrogenedens sp.]|nr:insulinase family protein [Candidatus Hydrogenedentota bacterium]NLF57184.1 insulinase family protein [Candidatus Hydrogenedens sp.]